MICDRCGGEARGYSVSYFSTEKCCFDCLYLERAHPLYEQARDVEEQHVRAGDYNFAGVGTPPDLTAASIAARAERLVLAYRKEGHPNWPPDLVEDAEWLMLEALTDNNDTADKYDETPDPCDYPEVVEWVGDNDGGAVMSRWHDQGHPMSLDEFYAEELVVPPDAACLNCLAVYVRGSRGSCPVCGSASWQVLPHHD